MKVVVFCPNWIGDVVMATPTLRALRKRFGDARIVGLVRPYVADVLAGNPWLDDVLLYDHKSPLRERRTKRVVERVRAEQFDVGVLLTNSLRSALVAWLGGVRRRVGYARDGRRILLNDPLRAPRNRRGFIPSPVIDYYLSMAYHLGAAPEAYTMELFTDADDERGADALWHQFGFGPGERVVALNPGSGYGPAKRWPSPYFSELARRLVDEQQAKVLILCGPGEEGFARFICDGSMRPRFVKSLAEQKLSIRLTKALIKRAALLVTTDSGPRHCGAAFGTPVVALFGPTHIEWTKTYYDKETRLQKPVPCGPCQLRTCPLEHHRCMTELSVSEVYAAAVAQLQRAVTSASAA